MPFSFISSFFPIQTQIKKKIQEHEEKYKIVVSRLVIELWHFVPCKCPLKI